MPGWFGWPVSLISVPNISGRLVFLSPNVRRRSEAAQLCPGSTEPRRLQAKPITVRVGSLRLARGAFLEDCFNTGMTVC